MPVKGIVSSNTCVKGIRKASNVAGLSETDVMDAALGTRTLLWFGHEFSGERMLLKHERNFGLGMDAAVSACSWNTRYYGLGMEALVSVCT